MTIHKTFCSIWIKYLKKIAPFIVPNYQRSDLLVIYMFLEELFSLYKYMYISINVNKRC